MLINNFMPPVELICSVINMIRPKKKFLSVCMPLSEVLVDLVPMAALKLARAVINERHMFFKKDSGMNFLKFRIMIYMENMLDLEKSATRQFVGSSMLVEVLNMLLELDVAIVWDDILRDDPCSSIFVMESEDDNEAADAGASKNVRSQEHRGKVTADLLDSLMI